MPIPFHINVFARAENLPRDYFKSCQSRFSAVTSNRELSEVRENLDEDSILVIDAGNDDEEVLASLRPIVADDRFHRYPIILVCPMADAFETVLEKYFPIAICLSTPCKLNELSEALDYAAKNYPDSGNRPDPELAEPGLAEAELAPKKVATSPKKRGGEKQLREATSLTSFDIRAESLRDGLKIEFETLRRAGLAPKDTDGFEAAVEIFEASKQVVQSRLARLAFLSKCFSEALQIPSDVSDDLKAAAIMYTHGVRGSRPRVFKANYLHDSTQIRLELSSFLKDSAITAATRFNCPRASKLIAGLARMVSKEDLPETDFDLLAVSSLAVTDLVERFCFPTGFFSSQGAHGLLKKLRADELEFIHPEARVCLSKFLAEAVERMPRAFVLTAEERNNPENIERQKNYEAYVLGPNEERVPLSRLKPGMRIAIPLTCFDGRPLLDSGIRLDDDLISRLWSLSAIRPLVASSIIVLDDIEEPKDGDSESLKHIN